MRFIAILRSIVWPSVFAVVLGLAAIIVAFTTPGSVSETLALTGAAVTCGLLSLRS